jgi:hypothetical protein
VSCGRSLEIDVARFARERGAPQWQTFEAHLATCADCRREIELVEQLGDSFSAGDRETGEHLATESLARFSEEPGVLLREERRDIILHLAACGSCRDELTVLQRLDSVLGPARAASGPPEHFGLLARVRRILSQPAFAYAVALLAIAAVLFDRPREPAPGSIAPPVAGSKGFDPSLAASVSESIEVELYPAARPMVRLGASSELLLRVPTALSTAAVKLSDEAGDLDIRRRIVAREGFVEIDVPSAWLRAGGHRVVVAPPGRDGAESTEFEFEVED